MTFNFLNETRTITNAHDWDAPLIDKLWLYNLHYFNIPGLKADGGSPSEWYREWMIRWMAENPVGQGTGWEPYPTSLRIVNWIKWVLSGQELPSECLASLAVSARWLTDRMEVHLSGNHLFSNAKALVFAGLFFEGREAQGWLDKGLRILEVEVHEQILHDGGQYERSPMYHALALEDMLDLYNVTIAFADDSPPHWRGEIQGWPDIIGHMRQWLAMMCHPDGEIGFFNDASFGIAPSFSELEDYAGRLGFLPLPKLQEGISVLKESGYIRLEKGPMTALLDIAVLGPDHQPGHGHADTLSFEMSLFKQRVIVNSGVSCYGLSPERLRQRGTAAHSTVIIDGKDSSEVWGGFRVARRARPKVLEIDTAPDLLKVTASHDGYIRLAGRNIHQRTWRAGKGCFEVEDEISGFCRERQARFHLHPLVKIDQISINGNAAELEIPHGKKVSVIIEGGTLAQEPSSWHPGFGLSEPSHCLVVHMKDNAIRTFFKWRTDC